MPPDLIEYLQQPLPQAVIWTTILVMATIIGGFVVQKFRGQSDNDRLTPNELLTNFREMNQEGNIEDAEFRTIKTVLGPKLIEPSQEQSKSTGKND
ncbi:MAG: hypothetical protein VB878_00170 [Pirellulaceae bacterium]